MRTWATLAGEPIRLAWFGLVLPALFLNYLGQGALVLQNPEAADNPFYRLAPDVGVVSAGRAGHRRRGHRFAGADLRFVLADDAGGATRLTRRASPSSTPPPPRAARFTFPWINWGLMLACIGLVLGFRSSDNLAAAYGIAVVLTMIITTLLLFFAARPIVGLEQAEGGRGCARVFLAAELAFLGANLAKVGHGGWFPLVVGLIGFTLMSTWKTGRRRLRQRLLNSLLPIEDFLKDVDTNPSRSRVPGTAIFLAGNPDGTPAALTHNFKHNKVIHKRVVLLTIMIEEIPFVEKERRVSVADLGQEILPRHRALRFHGRTERGGNPQALQAAWTELPRNGNDLFPQPRDDHRQRTARAGALAQAPLRLARPQCATGQRLLPPAAQSRRRTGLAGGDLTAGHRLTPSMRLDCAR